MGSSGMDILLFFTIYSFLGWMLESGFACIVHGKFINRGFLAGFFCPLYGFSAVLVLLSSEWTSSVFGSSPAAVLISILMATMLVTGLEYLTGFLLEKIFHCKWWDYSNKTANLRGYICLEYSVLWGLLAFVLLQYVHPVISSRVFLIPAEVKAYLVIAFVVYFFADAVKSVGDALNLMEVILNYANIPVIKYRENVLKYKRFFLAFPRLMVLNAGIINRDVRSILNERLNKIKIELKNRFL
ncbi:putative ABC transporter permease [Dehalobacter sp. TBBPA1]|uniref:putative ABC transporter permease n=1 Tax=Dehalobacter sp. TBBPA1 TaxID=3235037 RepID=UPI0034A11499